jgi:hypothetical protein
LLRCEDRVVPAAPAVALVESDLAFFAADVQARLQATGLFSTVDVIDVGPEGPGTLPTLSQLENYQAIMVWTDYAPNDPTGLGDLMAQYDADGFGVVDAVFSETNKTYGVSGQWVTGGLSAFKAGGFEFSPELTLGTVAQPNHPVMNGPAGVIDNFDGGVDSWRDKVTLNPGANLIASWSNGEPLAAEQTAFSGNIVSLNMWPVSNDAYLAEYGADGGWDTSTQGTELMANALSYAASVHIKPPIADAGGPYTINLGDPVTLDASKSSDPNTPPLPLSYSWDINGDGVYGDATGVNPTISWAQLQSYGFGVGTHKNITVEVDDGVGHIVDSLPTTLTINDIPPTAPGDTNSAPNQVLDNVINGTPVGITARSTNLNGEKITYSLTNNAGGRYAINSTTGVVTVANASLLNGPQTDTITVKATDAGGTATTDFTINEIHVAPTATITYSGRNIDVPVNVSLINATDNPTELAAGLTYSFDTDYYQHVGTYTWEQVGSANSAQITFHNLGTYTIAAEVSDQDGASTIYTIDVVIDTSGNGGVVGTRYIAAAKASGTSSLVDVFDTTGKLKFILIPGFSGGVRLAAGDVNGDGIEDIIVGTGPGTPAQVDVFSGVDGSLLANYQPYSSKYTGGVNLATADINKDNFTDIIVSPAGGSPTEPIVVYSGHHVINNAVTNVLQSFTPSGIGNTGWTIGVGDVNGDGIADYVVGEAGSGGMAQVINGSTLKSIRTITGFAGYKGAVSVAVGDVNGDGYADIILGEGSRTKNDSMVMVINGKTMGTMWSFDVYPAFNGGVNLSSDDIDGDGKTDILIGAGAGRPSGSTTAPPLLVLKGSKLTGLLVLNPYSTFTGGIYVG